MTILLKCLVLTFLWRVVESMHPHSDDSSFAFSQYDLSSDDFTSIVDSNSEDFSDDESNACVVSSSLLYDGGCQISAQALMCTGGEMSMDSVEQENLSHYFDFSDDDEDDDDDDDDDDDGHSSMLSNASLRRTRVSSSGIQSEGQSYGEPRSGRSDGGQSVAFSPTSAHRKQSIFAVKSSFSTALSVRGGASASSIIASEFSKKLLVTALVTLIYEFVIGHILEFIKIVMQTSPPGTTYAKVIKDITAEKGIGGLWDGFCPWGVVQALFKGSVFGLAHSVATSLLVPLAEDGVMPMALALTLAGGIGGGFQGYVLSPTLLLKTRVMTNEVFREKMSLLRTTWLSFRIGFDVVQSEGVSALMKGANVFATKRVFDWATRFFFSDMFEGIFLSLNDGQPLSIKQKLSCSLLGGTMSTISTLPLDVLVAKTQDAKKAGVKVSAFQMFLDDIKEGGWKGISDSYLAGFEARLAHVCLTTAAIKTLTPVAYDMLFGAKK